MRPCASIVITTRNRHEDVMTAVESCLAQSGVAVETVVFDDASDDGTAEAIRAAFPGVRLFANPQRAGLVANRSCGFHQARGRFVFSLDDDAYFTSSDTVARIVRQFEADDTVAAIAIPYLEPAQSQSMSTRACAFSRASGSEIASFAGCAHAVRRDVVLALGGYRSFFVHQGEERDLCLRIWASGKRIVYGDAGRVVHMVSPNRDIDRMSYYGMRNAILNEWLNSPFPNVLGRIPRRIAGQLAYRFSLKSLAVKLSGLAAGVKAARDHARARQPVSVGDLSRFDALPRHGPEAWNSALPGPAFRQPSASVKVHDSACRGASAVRMPGSSR